jgi:hypothetical protein
VVIAGQDAILPHVPPTLLRCITQSSWLRVYVKNSLPLESP